MRKKKFKILRKKYPQFIYQGYSFKIPKNDLKIFFDFVLPSTKRSKEQKEISSGIKFHPEITVKNIDKRRLTQIGKKVLNNLVFHLGLMEIPSYWKATCSPEIVIGAGNLNEDQIKWWKKLIMKGMGQFFYENKIDFRKPNFLKIKTINENGSRCKYEGKLDSNRILIPIGGGKDSIVTLEIFKKAKKKIRCFSLNPTQATKKIIKVGNFKNAIIVERKIDKKLLELNRRGFLNGHTPFSAYLAFLSTLLAVIFDYKYIAFSNERSSNEGNVKYLGKIVNHQWSKSFEFENLFRKYSKKYLTGENVEYFSFLRPLYEIQIAKLFANYPKYFSSFLSCNEAFKTYSGRKVPIGKWCCGCPKCLFVFACLYPFIETKKLIKIFGKNLFQEKKLLPTMLELIGLRKFKPFECVGTKKESLIAFYLSWKKNKKLSFDGLPVLLNYFGRKISPRFSNLEKETKKIMNSWCLQNNLPREFKETLKMAAKSLTP